MSTADELLARLKTVPGVSAAFDTEPPSDRYTFSSAPTLILMHVSTVPDIPIDGSILGTEDRWQVSVYGTNLSNVRAVAQGAIDALHGYVSETIKLVQYESWPGTIADGSGPTRIYHAPVDFTASL